MPRYTGYVRKEDIDRISAESRAVEKAAEANRGIVELRSDILRLNIMVQAMLEIMMEQGVDTSLINAKIDEIVDRPGTFAPHKKDSKPCPKCGRIILDNGNTPLVGTCLYCGTVVMFPPYVKTGEDIEAEDGETAEAEAAEPGIEPGIEPGTESGTEPGIENPGF